MTLFWLGTLAGALSMLALVVAYSVGIAWWLMKDGEE